MQSLLAEHAASIEDDLQIVRDAMLALGRMPGEEALHALLSSVRKGHPLGVRDPDVAASLAMALASTRNAEVAPRLLALATEVNQPTNTRSVCTTLIGLLDGADRETVDALKAIVEARTGRDEVICAAAMALGAMRGYSSTEILRKRLAREEGIYVRSHLLTALSFTSDPAVTEDLLPFVKDSDRFLRLASIHALGGLLDGTGTLTGEKAEDSGHAPDAIERARGIASVRLRDVADHGPDHTTRGLALLALGRIGGDDNVQALRKVARDGQGQLRAAACLALALTGQRQIESDLSRLLVDDSEMDEVRAAGAIALGILGDVGNSARGRLRALTARQHPSILRRYAAVALGLLGDHPSRGALEKNLAASDGDPAVRISAAMGLALLGSDPAHSFLLETIRGEKDPDQRAALLATFGASPTRAPAQSLLEIARSDSDDLPRAAALHAMGHLYDEMRPPRMARLLCNRDYFMDAKPLNTIRDNL